MQAEEILVIKLSELEFLRFGVTTARAQISSQQELKQALEFCSQQSAQLLIARVPTNRPAITQALLSSGGILADTLYVLKRKCHPLDAIPKYIAPDACVRPAVPADAQHVAALVQSTFQNYPNHYSANPRLDPQACAEVYPDWAYRLCQGNDKTASWVAEAKGAIIGFLGATLSTDTHTQFELGTIAKPWQGRGVYEMLMKSQIDMDRQRGVLWEIYPTQIANIPSQAAAIRLGFTPKESFHTIHCWVG